MGVSRRPSRGVVGLPVAGSVAAKRRSTTSAKKRKVTTAPVARKCNLLSPILIDNRAGSSDLISYPPLNVHGELCRLSAGDISITGNGPRGPVRIGVEVKSITDLISSFSNGRLQDTQIPGMQKEYDVLWLLYYGVYRPSPVDGSLEILRGKRGWQGYQIGARAVPYGYVESFLLTLTAVGVHVKRVQHLRKDEALAECAEWIGVLARWWSKPWTKHRGMHAFDFSGAMSLGMPGVDAHTHMLARFAMQLSGVGYDRALAVARHFQSIIDMVAADESEWAKIPGIGKVIAGSAVSEMRRRLTLRERNKKRERE